MQMKFEAWCVSKEEEEEEDGGSMFKKGNSFMVSIQLHLDF